MDKNAIAKKLNRNVEVVMSSFENYGITVVSYGFCRIDEDTGSLDLLVEIEEESGFRLEHDLQLKANLYDEDHDIIYSGNEFIYEDDFAGYDTICLHLGGDDLANHAKSCRIYVTKG